MVLKLCPRNGCEEDLRKAIGQLSEGRGPQKGPRQMNPEQGQTAPRVQGERMSEVPEKSLRSVSMGF